MDNRSENLGVNLTLKQKRAELTRVFETNIPLPHLSPKEFDLIGGLYTEPIVIEVPVNRIVISSSLENWGDVEEFDQESHLESLWETFTSIKEFGFSIKRAHHGRPHLHDFGGIYSVTDGQRRIMAAKALGIEQISAMVVGVYPTTMHLPTERWYKEMESRKNRGLWEGNLSFSLDAEGGYKEGTAQVYNYEGIWVLTRNMERVKSVYRQVGASGKADVDKFIQVSQTESDRD